MIEEGTVVIAEGAVQARFKTGDILDAVFCDVFEFEGLKIKTDFLSDEQIIIDC